MCDVVIFDWTIVAENMTCHEECTSRTSCWGFEDHQCDVNGCKNYQYKNRCVPDCSNASLEMPVDSSGVFQNETSNTCDVCNAECVGGCINGTVSRVVISS